MTKTEKELFDYNQSALEFNKLLLRKLKALNVKYEALAAELKSTKAMLRDVLLDGLFNEADNEDIVNP